MLSRKHLVSSLKESGGLAMNERNTRTRENMRDKERELKRWKLLRKKNQKNKNDL
jgi:hypothetical protein